jgi:hypothetical protein
VREAAREAGKKLGVDPLPAYKPEEAFTAALDAQLKAIATMVCTEIPTNAAFRQLTITHASGQEGEEPDVQKFSAWVLSQEGGVLRHLDLFACKYHLDLAGAAEPAPKLIGDPDKIVRFYAGLILLKYGDAAKEEALDTIAAVLAEEEGTDLYEVADLPGRLATFSSRTLPPRQLAKLRVCRIAGCWRRVLVSR